MVYKIAEVDMSSGMKAINQAATEGKQCAIDANGKLITVEKGGRGDFQRLRIGDIIELGNQILKSGTVSDVQKRSLANSVSQLKAEAISSKRDTISLYTLLQVVLGLSVVGVFFALLIQDLKDALQRSIRDIENKPITTVSNLDDAIKRLVSTQELLSTIEINTGEIETQLEGQINNNPSDPKTGMLPVFRRDHLNCDGTAVSIESDTPYFKEVRQGDDPNKETDLEEMFEVMKKALGIKEIPIADARQKKWFETLQAVTTQALNCAVIHQVKAQAPCALEAQGPNDHFFYQHEDISKACEIKVCKNGVGEIEKLHVCFKISMEITQIDSSGSAKMVAARDKPVVGVVRSSLEFDLILNDQNQITIPKGSAQLQHSLESALQES